jgi:hypothetical protein
VASQYTVSVFFVGVVGRIDRILKHIATVDRDTADTPAGHLPYTVYRVTFALFSPCTIFPRGPGPPEYRGSTSLHTAQYVWRIHEYILDQGSL